MNEDYQPVEDPIEQGAVSPVVQPNMTVDEEGLEFMIDAMRAQQNLPMAICGGLIGAIIGAALWGIVTAVTHFQIGFMALGVGCLVGYLVRIFGHGLDKHFGYVGAALALLGCLAGNLLSVCIMLGNEFDVPLLDILMNLRPGGIVELMTATFYPMDLLFYGISIYEGYRFSLRRITPEDLQTVLKPAES